MKQTRRLRVQQWSKDDLRIFWLEADDVGCCLATTAGPQFHAMVQRRMDNAMLIHTVIDEDTRSPVALIWLYLAEKENGEIILVRNFIEIAAKYGVNDDARSVIVNALLYFTGEMYCRDNPGIKGFFINQLTYG